MDYLSSPLVKKIVGEISSNRKRQFSAPNEVCLGDWWLSKPDNGVGVSVSGYPFEMRRCHNTRQSNSATGKKRYAMRLFESKQIVKRDDCNRLESSDGLMVFLCGFINRSRTKENGFSSEVCRDFIYGFPLNWEVAIAQGVDDKPSNPDHESSLLEHTLTTAIDSSNGAQLHDLVLSLTDIEREALTKKVSDNLLQMLNPKSNNTAHLQPSKLNPSCPVDTEIMTPKSCTVTKAMNSMSGENVGSPKTRKNGVKGKSSAVLSSRNDVYQNEKRSIVECVDFSDHKYSIKHDILTHNKCSPMTTTMNSKVGKKAGSSERQASRVRRSRRLERIKAVNYFEE